MFRALTSFGETCNSHTFTMFAYVEKYCKTQRFVKQHSLRNVLLSKPWQSAPPASSNTPAQETSNCPCSCSSTLRENSPGPWTDGATQSQNSTHPWTNRAFSNCWQPLAQILAADFAQNVKVSKLQAFRKTRRRVLSQKARHCKKLQEPANTSEASADTRKKQNGTHCRPVFTSPGR